MHRLFIFLFAAAILPVCVHAQQTFTLDGAIAESMDYITEKLPEKTKVAVLKVKTLNEELTDYISVECDNYIKDNTLLVLANKKQLPEILKRNNIADLNKASEEDVIKVAGLLGAKAVVFVGFDKRDGNYRFFIQMYDTETAQTNGMLALPVELDGLLADFTGETYISPEKRREMAKDEELARVKKELEDIKAHNAKLQKEQEAAKLQNQSDFDAAFSDLEARKKGGDVRSRLESETAQRQTPAVVQKSETSEQNGIGVEELLNLLVEQKLQLLQNNSRPQSNRLRLLSARGEVYSNFKGRTVGGIIEWGVIGDGGFYFSGELGGGWRYWNWGGGVNFGGCINRDGAVKVVLGLSTGFWVWLMPVNYKMVYNDYTESFYDGWNYDFKWGGPFLKLMFGKTNNFDITNRVSFGFSEYRNYYRNYYYDYYDYYGYYYYYDYYYTTRFSVNYSLSAGYTLTKKRRK